MKEITLLFAGLFGMFAVIFGAFGAHALKKKLTPIQLTNFETGVKYQMYHAIVLLVLACSLNFETVHDTATVYCFIMGTFLFSFSIYALVLSAAKNKKYRFLGPITPMGGLLLVIAWGMLVYKTYLMVL